MMGASGMVSFPDRPKRYWIPSPIQRRVGFLPRRKALYMLPVCKCFTSPTETIRTHGCSLCTSPINKKTARHFAEYGDEIIQVFLVVSVCVCLWGIQILGCAGSGKLGALQDARQPASDPLRLLP